MIIKEIIIGKFDHDTAVVKDGDKEYQIVINKNQPDMVGKNVEIKDGVITEIKEAPVKKFTK